MIELIFIVLSTVIVSLLSIIGIVTIGIDDKKLNKAILLLVALSAGSAPR